MSDYVIFGARQLANEFKPAVTNVVSNVSAPYRVSFAAKSAGSGIVPIAKAGTTLMDVTKNGLSGVPKEKFDAIFNTVKKTAKQNLKNNSKVTYGGVVAGKAGKKSFGKIFTSVFKKVKISGKMKVAAVVAALGIAAYIYFKD